MRQNIIYHKRGFLYFLSTTLFLLLTLILQATAKPTSINALEATPTYRLEKVLGETGNSTGVTIRGMGRLDFDPSKLSVWHPAVDNPYLTSLPGGHTNIYAPSVINYNNRWYLYYGGWDGTTDQFDRISLTISKTARIDKNWGARQVVIDKGPYDHVNDPSVYHDGNKFYMAYTSAKKTPCNNTLYDQGWLNISESSDGINWSPISSNSGEIILHGAPIDLINLGRPSLYKDGDLWHLYFDNGGSCPDVPPKTYHATSTDLKNFNFQGIAINQWSAGGEMQKFGDYYYYSMGHFERGIFQTTGKDVKKLPSLTRIMDLKSASPTSSYVTNPSIIRSQNKLMGILYSTHIGDLSANTTISAAFLQRKPTLNSSTGSPIEHGGIYALNPSTTLIKFLDKQNSVTGTLSIYDSDGATLLTRLTNANLNKGDIYQLSQITPTQPGDLNNDKKVDIFDYNLLVSNYGNPYTIQDYNNVVTNYGKNY